MYRTIEEILPQVVGKDWQRLPVRNTAALVLDPFKHVTKEKEYVRQQIENLRQGKRNQLERRFNEVIQAHPELVEQFAEIDAMPIGADQKKWRKRAIAFDFANADAETREIYEKFAKLEETVLCGLFEEDLGDPTEAEETI